MFNFSLFASIAFQIYIMCMLVKKKILSFRSVLVFHLASSMKENSNWLSKTTLEEVSGADSIIIYPKSHFWLALAVAATGMYSCPVATMFCEKLLTRRDIAENLRASVIGVVRENVQFCLKPQSDVWENCCNL